MLFAYCCLPFQVGDAFLALSIEVSTCFHANAWADWLQHLLPHLNPEDQQAPCSPRHVLPGPLPFLSSPIPAAALCAG